MIALSALMSAGIVTAFDFGGARLDDQAAAVQIAQRFPRSDESFVRVVPAKSQPQTAAKPIVAAGKGDRMAKPGCATQEWPYIAPNCLVAADGAQVRKVSRVITVERRTGENSSELVRVPVTAVAAR
jgi:hypothetical protein